MIETTRLEILNATEDDIFTIMDMENDKDNSDYISSGTYEEHLNEIKDSNHLVLMIKEKNTGDVVGYLLIGLDFKSNIFEVRRIAITKKGVGYGKESMTALIKYAFEETNTNRLWLDVYTDNKVGIKLYESLGMYKEGILRQNNKLQRGYVDLIIYSILREEYKKLVEYKL